MRSWSKNLGWMAAGVALALAVAIFGGAVMAQDADTRAPAAGETAPAGARGPGGFMGAVHRGGAAGGVLIDAVADTFGLTRAELLEALQEHRTIVNLANARNVSLDTVKANIVAAADAQHDEAVAAGWMTREQADARLQQLTDNLDRILGSEFPLRPMGGPRGMRGPGGFGGAGGPGGVVATVVTEELGITLADLRQAHQDGKSIAQLAEEKGISLDTLKAEILAAADAHHDELVAAGRLTREQADQLQANFAENLDQMLNATGPLGPMGGLGPCSGGQGFRGGRGAGGFGPGRMGPGFGPGPNAPQPAPEI